MKQQTSDTEKKNENPARHGRDLTTGSIPKHLIVFSMPMLAGNLLQTAYSFINAIWVGKFLGKTALAAVTVSFPIIFVLMALAGGLTLAANILISQYAGAQQWRDVRRVVQTSAGLTCLISVVLAIVGQIFTEPMLRAMGTPADVLPQAVSYMRIMLVALPFNFGLFLISSTLRGIGDSTTPLYFQTVFLAITAILDPILMFGWLGMPRFGLNGTAIATVVTLFGALFSTVVYLHRKQVIVSPDWRRLNLERETSWLLVKIGFPAAIQQSLVSIGMVFVIGFINAFGENATAAFGAVSRIDQLAFLPAMAINMAVATLAGQNIGANRHHRVHEVFWWAMLLTGSITLLVSAATILFPTQLLSLFIQKGDPEVLAMATSYLHIVGGCYIFFAAMFVANGVINGAGQTFITTIISLVGLWVVRVPLAYLLPKYVTHDVTGIWYSMSISFGTTMTISLIYYFSGKWKTAKITHRAMPCADEADEEATNCVALR